jgi:hypothetical protein
MDRLRFGAYCRNSKQLYAWTCSRRRRRSRRRGGLIANVMSEIQGCKISHVIDDVTNFQGNYFFFWESEKSPQLLPVSKQRDHHDETHAMNVLQTYLSNEKYHTNIEYFSTAVTIMGFSIHRIRRKHNMLVNAFYDRNSRRL